jgi:hypothetical protein
MTLCRAGLAAPAVPSARHLVQLAGKRTSADWSRFTGPRGEQPVIAWPERALFPPLESTRGSHVLQADGKRVGFMARQIEVPDDFDTMGQQEI